VLLPTTTSSCQYQWWIQSDDKGHSPVEAKMVHAEVPSLWQQSIGNIESLSKSAFLKCKFQLPNSFELEMLKPIF